MESAGLETLALEPVWSIFDHAALRPALGKVEPWVEPTLKALHGALPVPPSARSFVAAPFYRPPGSHRSFYLYPAACRGRESDPPWRGVIALKGQEPLTHDLDAVLGGFAQPSGGWRSILEHLIFEERKTPGALGLAEARAEASRAAEMQAAHLDAFGELARVPLPLFVCRHQPSAETRVLDILRSLVSDAALEAVASVANRELGVLLYYYPTPPVRVRDVQPMLDGLDFRGRMFALVAMGDPAMTVARWTDLFARMLRAGLLPGSVAAIHTGICCQPQNTCLDGGFVDFDSVTPVDSLRSEAAIHAALQLSTQALLATVRSFLLGETDGDGGPDARIDRHHLDQFTMRALIGALEEEGSWGRELDPRISRYFRAAPTFDALVERLGSCSRSADAQFASRARDFAAFGRDIVAVAAST